MLAANSVIFVFVCFFPLSVGCFFFENIIDAKLCFDCVKSVIEFRILLAANSVIF